MFVDFFLSFESKITIDSFKCCPGSSDNLTFQTTRLYNREKYIYEFTLTNM